MSYFRNKATLGLGFAAAFPLTIYFFLIFFGKNHGNWLIISLLSMLCFALIYVSIQHIDEKCHKSCIFNVHPEKTLKSYV